MSFALLSVGKRMPLWVAQGCDEYAKRLPKQWQFQLREFAQSRGETAALRMEAESRILLDAVPEKAHVVGLDNRGESWSTERLAEELQRWLELGKPVNFLIGGPDGLHPNCRQRANQLVSLSALTFPHPMVRVIWLEQLYRAHSILQNHPYHRAG